MTTLRLDKHHGLGNDFLVVLDPLPPEIEQSALAIRVCDRRRGLGADGLLTGDQGADGTWTMVVHNADGSRAEISGNGLRCFAQAIARRSGSLDPLRINTDAGQRRVELLPTDDPATVHATVEMGAVTEVPEPERWYLLGATVGRPAAHLLVGNPHSVVPVDDVRVVDLAAVGAKLPHVNLEIIEAGPEPNAITMRVHERGVGITEACGSGACAAAFAAHRWGIATPEGGKIVVHMDGGSASVVLDAATVSLEGPATHIATAEVNLP